MVSAFIFEAVGLYYPRTKEFLLEILLCNRLRLRGRSSSPATPAKRGCCKLKTCGNPGSQSDPNFPFFIRKSHENTPRKRGKGNFQGAEARKCNSPFLSIAKAMVYHRPRRISSSQAYIIATGVSHQPQAVFRFRNDEIQFPRN